MKAYIDQFWETEILPTISRYIEIPNESPEFDSKWRENGHMQRAVFTLIDENHHREDWTFILPGDKQIVASFNATRVQTVAQK